MTSNKQLHANRANATKSTGPRSQAGKAQSRLNSRKHGLTAKMLIVVGENADDFDKLRAELMDDHDPQSALECELVERLAGILWRLRRVPSFEAAILEALEAEVAEDKREEEEWRRRWHSYVEEEEGDADSEEEETSDEERSAYVGRRLNGGYGDGLGKLARHEAALMNAFTKTLHMLLLLQENRGSKPVILEAVSLPAAA